MNRETGAAIGTLEHIGQSISDILTTRLGTRVMRREYGSLLPELVDQPFNDATRLRVYAASVMAIMRWEPRVSLTRIQLQGASLQGQVVMDIEGRVLDRNQALSMSLPLQLGGGAWPSSWAWPFQQFRLTTVTWPREYARQIVAMPTREERNAALLEVPEHLRELTKRHCLNAWNHPARHPPKPSTPAHE